MGILFCKDFEFCMKHKVNPLRNNIRWENNLKHSLQVVKADGGPTKADGGPPKGDGGPPPADGGLPPADGGPPPVDGGRGPPPALLTPRGPHSHQGLQKVSIQAL